MSTERAVTVSFLSIAFARLWHVFNMRENRSSFFVNQVTRNPFIWGALALCTGLLLIAAYVPPVAAVLRVVRPGAEGWLLIAGISLLPFILGRIGKYILSRRVTKKHS